MIGSGLPGDPHRVPLPTYQLLHGNATQGWAYVSIADEHILPEDHDLDHEKVEETTDGPHYPELCAKCKNAAHSHMDDRYQEHKGEFRIELA